MRTTIAPSPKIVLNIANVPVISPSEPALLVTTEDGEDDVLEVVETLTEVVPEPPVDAAEVFAVEFPALGDDALDEVEEPEEELVAEDEAEEDVVGGVLEEDELALVLELELELELEPPGGLRTPPCNFPADEEEDVPAAADLYDARVLPEVGGLITPTIPL
jgi:hypothetical protein